VAATTKNARRATKPASQKAASGKRAANNATAASPAEYAREAFSEWSKAARYGAAALVASGGSDKDKKSDSKAEKPPLKERLNPATTEKGGRVGDAADNLLSKLGFLGRAASKLSLGSRAVDKVVPDAVAKLQPGGRGDSGERAATQNGSGQHPPIPIQESVDLALPVRSAFALATRFEDVPQWSDRIGGAEKVDDDRVSLDLKVRGTTRSIELEITDLHAPLRIEWEATEGVDAGGMLTFHELAPSLTRVELSLDIEPESPVQRLTRTIHLPDRIIRSELHRFKAWAELWQEVEDIEPPEEPEDEFEEEPEDEAELDQEPEDEEEDFEEEPEDEFEDGPEDEFEDDEEPEEEFEDEEEPEDEFVDEEDEDFEEEDFDEEGEPARTR
jgi:uncharacterized membrane protein